jgi:NAD(P)H-dependent FMN reductase
MSNSSTQSSCSSEATDRSALVLPRIGIVLSTTRHSRFADRPADWLLGIAGDRTDASFEIVDLRDYPLPFFDEALSPMMVPSANEVARRWAEKIASLDAYIFVTAEYNHSVPAVLKNALDYVYAPFSRKPATFVGYGNTGAARGIEQLRLILAELQVASLKHTVHIGYTEFVGMLMKEKTFADYPHLEHAAVKMIDDLVWWTRTLRSGREA